MIIKVDYTFGIINPKQQLIVRYKQRILGPLISGNSICGYPGVGKTTLANELAPYIDAVVLSSDKVRKELNYKRSYTEEGKILVYNILLSISKYLHNPESIASFMLFLIAKGLGKL